MLSLPEAMLLFALHDQKGSVRSAAYLSLDGILRGAVLGELLLRGAVRIRSDGAIRRAAAPIDSPLLLRALEALEAAPDPHIVEGWLFHLKRHFPELNEHVTAGLIKKGALHKTLDDRTGLSDTQLLPTIDASFEAEMVKQVRLGVACGPNVPRRMGILIGLIHVSDLWSAFGDPQLTAQGRGVGEWVLGRDALCKAVRIDVYKAEGTFEM